eukprot:876866-Pyramimonas_sp.AAC.1
MAPPTRGAPRTAQPATSPRSSRWRRPPPKAYPLSWPCATLPSGMGIETRGCRCTEGRRR